LRKLITRCVWCLWGCLCQPCQFQPLPRKMTPASRLTQAAGEGTVHMLSPSAAPSTLQLERRTANMYTHCCRVCTAWHVVELCAQDLPGVLTGGLCVRNCAV
jgi:hypothetical protein